MILNLEMSIHTKQAKRHQVYIKWLVHWLNIQKALILHLQKSTAVKKHIFSKAAVLHLFLNILPFAQEKFFVTVMI